MMDNWLERVTNFAIIGSAVLLLAATVNSWRAQTSVQQPQSPRYKVGESVAELDSHIDFAAAPRTVLVYLNSNCRFCVASAPFYRRLVTHRNETGSRVRIIAIGKQPQEVLTTFLAEQNITVDQAVALANPTKFKMNTTPALLAVDRSGTIDSLWIGQVPAGDEERALRTLVAN